jgi:hypothetical protein
LSAAASPVAMRFSRSSMAPVIIGHTNFAVNHHKVRNTAI